MEKQEIDGITIYWAVLGAMMTAWVIQWAISIAVAQATVQQLFGALPTNPPAVTRYLAPTQVPHAARTINIPGKSVEECNAETGGVLNDQWNRCRHGYQKTVSE